MKIIGTTITGSVLVNGNDVTTNLQTLNIWSGSVATTIISLNSTTSSLNNVTASLNNDIASLLNYTASNNAAISDILLETASINTFTSSINSRTSIIEGKYATTGSNIFNDNQTISGSLFISQNLVVQGSSSIQNITASAVSIGTNTVILNTDTPSVRFGGIKVQDSGSGAGVSGSLLWDSLNNHWIYQHPAGGAESGISARLISGPKNSGSLGNEAGITSGKIIVAVGDDHIGDSIMTQTGTVISVAGDLTATSLTGSINGSQLTNSTVANAKLANSTISGIALGSNLATLTIGTGLSGTSYNGSGAVTIANTGVTSIVAGTNISISGGTGAVTITNGITNNNQLTNGAGYITSAGSISGNAATATALSSGQSNWSGTGVLGNVVGLLAWKNYGNSHVIFDASNSTSPSGGGVNNTNATIAWTGTYPTLMGWNGSNTYGVRVDSARTSDITAQRTFSNVRTDGINRGSYGSISVAGSSNTYGGIDFTDQSMTLMINAGATGFYYTNNTWRVYWDGSGNQQNTGDVTAYASDKRLKTNITNIPNALDKIRSINGVTYDWKLDECAKWDFNPQKHDVGVIAQEIQEICPEAVTFAPFDRDPIDGSKSKSGENYLTVKYEKLVPLLIEAIKEQQSQIEELKTTINGLTK